MDSKTKHRLLIFLVVIGLVVILLPLFQGGSDVSTKTDLVKAPPFPDESVKAVSEVPKSAVISVDENRIAIPDQSSSVAVVDSNGSVLDDDPTDTLDLDFGADDDILMSNDIPAPATPEATAPAAEPEPAVKPEEKSQEKQESNSAANAKPKSNKVAAKAPSKPVVSKKVAGVVKKLAQGKKGLVIKDPSKNERDLINASKSAWAVQVGTFKNKDNAFRLLNKLRAKGYKAFVKRMSHSSRFASKVLVGPANSKKDAGKLANRLSDDLAMDVIVVSYKPLALS